MTPTVLLTSLGIVLARVVDVSLGTLRMINVVQGRKSVAAGLGFIEILIWVVVVSSVIQNLDQPLYIVSYAGGFALGTYVGILLEEWIGRGERVVRIFSRSGADMARRLRDASHVVTEFRGEGREGPVDLLFLHTPRKRVLEVMELARTVDPESFCIVDDVRSGARVGPRHSPAGLAGLFKGR